MHQTRNPANSANCCGAKHTKAEENLQINSNPSRLVAQSSAAQRQRILDHLLISSLTTLQARDQLDVMHPAARCMELRRRGHDIRTEWTTEYSSCNVRHRIARYILHQEGKK